MGDCSLCGKPAGLFRSMHEECEALHLNAVTTMIGVVKSAVLNGAVETLESNLRDISRENHVSETELSECILSGWEGAVEHFLEDGSLGQEEETKLLTFLDKTNLSKEMLNRKGVFSRVLKAGVIKDLLEGKIPHRIQVDYSLTFNFQKSEQLIWLFTDVDYLEDQTKTEYVGRSQGVSIRIMSGVYYRIGGYKGRPVEHTERLRVDKGLMAITTKHIYFSGPKKSFRIRHNKVVSLSPYSDGVAIVRDAANAKLQIFVTGDGWFTHNLLANVQRLEQ